MNEEIDDLVQIELIESYQDILGPPGARGMPETGHLIQPQDLSASESNEAISAVEHEAHTLGIKFEPGERRQKSRGLRYDFATVTEVTKWLSAIGAGGLAVRFLNRADAHITQWLKNRAGRTVTITKGDWKISTKGDVDVKAIVEELERRESKNP
jgi:hypothetical protein